MVELFGFLYFCFLFWKAVQKKIQQNVALKSKNQILSIKKFILTISSEFGKRRRPRMKEKSGRQLASGMKAISLSTLQRKAGGRRQGLPGYPRKHCLGSLQSSWPTSPVRQQGCWESCASQFSWEHATIPSAERANGSEGMGFRTGAQERVMKAAAFRIGMSRLLPASLWALGTATLLLRAFLGIQAPAA